MGPHWLGWLRSSPRSQHLCRVASFHSAMAKCAGPRLPLVMKALVCTQSSVYEIQRVTSTAFLAEVLVTCSDLLRAWEGGEGSPLHTGRHRPPQPGPSPSSRLALLGPEAAGPGLVTIPLCSVEASAVRSVLGPQGGRTSSHKAQASLGCPLVTDNAKTCPKATALGAGVWPGSGTGENQGRP